MNDLVVTATGADWDPTKPYRVPVELWSPEYRDAVRAALLQFDAETTLQVGVDFNSVNRRGQVKTTLRRAAGPVRVGSRVVAVDPYTDMRRRAAVVSVDESTGRVLLDVDWDTKLA